MPESSGSPDICLVVGLGNPGREYEGTRHNIGFAVVEAFAAHLGGSWKREPRWKGDLCRAGSLMLLKPSTFMNLSGESVAAVSGYYKIAPAGVVVVVDDTSLPLGRIRLRRGGSAGGHNGLRSVIDHLGTEEFPRLRVGVGSPGHREMVPHVLGRFAPEERGPAQDAVGRATEALLAVRDRGFENAMNIYNAQPTTENP